MNSGFTIWPSASRSACVVRRDVEPPARWSGCSNRRISGPMTRWWRAGAKVCPVKARKGQDAEKVSPERIAVLRERLASLSWFMRALAGAHRPLGEPGEDPAPAVSGLAHRFESGRPPVFFPSCRRLIRGRFRSQALLDERAILAAMAYVDLNPVRAGIASTLSECAYTSVARRLAEQCEVPAGEPSGRCHGFGSDRRFGLDRTTATRVTQPPTPTRCGSARCHATGRALCRLSGSGRLEWIRAGMGEARRAADVAAGLLLLEWQEQLAAMRTAGRAVGGTERMRALAERLKQCWVQRGRRVRQTGQGERVRSCGTVARPSRTPPRRHFEELDVVHRHQRSGIGATSVSSARHWEQSMWPLRNHLPW